MASRPTNWISFDSPSGHFESPINRDGIGMTLKYNLFSFPGYTVGHIVTVTDFGIRHTN